MGDQPTSDEERAPEEATTPAAESLPEPDEAGGVDESAEVTAAAEPAEPAGPSEPAETPEPAAPAEAVEPAETDEATEPDEPAEVTEPVEAVEAPEATEPPEVSEPEDAEPSEPEDAEPSDETAVSTLSADNDDTVLITMPKRPVGEDTVIIRAPEARQPGDDTVIIKLPSPPEPKNIRALTTVRRKAAEDDTVLLRLPGEPEEPRTGFDLGWAPWVLALSSLGVVLVALAYAGGRHQASWAMAAYWAGQVVVFSPVVFRLLSRLAGVAESFVLVMGLAANQYMLKWMYSPDQFRFPDELQHWLAAGLITESGELFRPNNALPPAVHFPGLAEMGAGLSLLTGLPVTGAGVIVAGVAHLMFVGLLFAAVLRASNSPAMAGVACVTYATAMHYLFFNSMFLYATAALPYFMLTVWAHRRWRTGGGNRFLALAVLGITMTTVSHHVTAFVLVATLLLLSLTELALERPRPWEALIPPALALAVVCCWIGFVAPDVIAYLEAPLKRIAAALSELFGGAPAAEAGPTKPVPLAQLAVQGLGILGLLVLFLAVARDMILRRDRDTWRWAALVGGAAFFAGNGARFLGAGGPEIAGRLSTFTYVPMSIIAAIAIVHAVRIVPPKDGNGRRWLSPPPPGVAVTTGRRLAGQVYIGTALITLLMVGARTGGWPPVSALLPGPYLAAAYERSVDAYGVDAARWQERNLPRESRVGGDITAVALSSTYGRIDPVREVGPLFHAPSWSPAEQELVRQLAIDYLVVDERLGELLPSDNAYFQNDPMAGRITEPLSDFQLGKFDEVPAVSRVYDNGTVRIYRMGRS